MQRVERAKSKFIPTDRLYRKALQWIENVRRQYPERPFDAIVTVREQLDIGPCLVVGEFFEDHPSWDVPRGFVVEREAASMARIAAPLVLQSREIVFVDPYFDPTCPEWWNPLAAILAEAVRGGRVLRRCELHLKLQKNRDGVVYDNRTFEELCKAHLAPVIPDGVELTVVRWEQLRGGEKLHPRYILTELGGLYFEAGLDEGKPGESTDVGILEPVILEKRRENYTLGSRAFRMAQGPIVVVGSSGR